MTAFAPPLRLLMSYDFFRDADLDVLLAKCQPYDVELFADCGAYTANKAGHTISLDEYCAWLRRWEAHIDLYPALDVIGNAVATDRNLRTMEDRGFTPVPVFHCGSPWPVLERYCETYPYVAVGGIAGMRSSLPWAWLVRVHEIAQRAGVGLHAFGVTGAKALRDLPWASADSSTWANGVRFGSCVLYDPVERALAHTPIALAGKQWYRIGRFLRAMGADPAWYGEYKARDSIPEGPFRVSIQVVSIASMMLFARAIGERHGPRPGYDRQPSPFRMFFVPTAARHLDHITAAHRHLVDGDVYARYKTLVPSLPKLRKKAVPA